MSAFIRRVGVVAAIAALLLAGGTAASAQGRREGQRRPPATVRPPAPRPAPAFRPAVRGEFVFVGGYFYDPFYGPYPWWGPELYPYPYFLTYDRRASVRLLVTPKTAAVYVDGFYAGVVDDFDGVFQGLPLPPGGHTIQLFLDGYRTVSHSVYLTPASTVKVHESLEQLAAGETSEPPMLAPPVPAPPSGSFRPPVTARRVPPPSPAAPPVEAASFGTIQLTIRPAGATVMIDGVRWQSSDAGQFVVQVPAGHHHIDVNEPGYTSFSHDLDVQPGQVTPLNVSLIRPT